MKFTVGFWVGVVAICLGTSDVEAADHSAIIVNLSSSEPSPLLTALQAQGLTAVAGDPAAKAFSGSLVVWESNGPIPPDTAAALGDFVQKGGGLLIGLSPKPGLGAVQLSFLSPTMAWETQRFGAFTDGEIGLGTADSEMFGKMDGRDVTVPYFFPIRPFHAVERGMERYAIYQYTNLFVNTPHAPGDFFWTRPLLDRDWKIRLQGNDRAETPLLLTGRYGAGHVAIFASGLDDSSPGLDAYFGPVIKWLNAPAPDLSKEPAAGAIQISSIAAAPASAGVPKQADLLQVSLKNTTDQALTVQVLGRFLTWERSPVADALQSVQVPASGEVTVDLPAPTPSPTNYQALEARDAFVVRTGVLSESGATLLAEKVAPVDFSPSTQLELHTDNLYKFTYPFTGAPGINTLGSMESRMGAPVYAYAYPPGATVNASVVLTNGVHDIVALAKVTDETTPDNPSVVALTAGGGRMGKNPRPPMMAYGSWQGKPGVENVLLFHFPGPVTVSGVALSGNVSEMHRFLWHNPGEVVVECDGKRVADETGLDARFVAEDGMLRLAFPPVQATDLRIRLPWVDAMPDKSTRLEPQLGGMEILGSLTPLPARVEGEASLVLRDSMSGTETDVAKEKISVPPGARVVWSQPVVLPKSDSAHYYQLEARFDGQTRQVPVLAIQPKRTLTSVEAIRPNDAPSMNFIVTRGFRNAFPLGTGTQEAKGGWETPDDLVWAYSHLAKQSTPNISARASSLYVTNCDFGHYSTPWVVFPDGEPILDAAAPNLIEEMSRQKGWATAKIVTFWFSDRWDTGPSLSHQYTWPEIVSFDEYLRSKGGPGLSGRTLPQLGDDINKKHQAEWDNWQQQSYVDRVQNLSKAFAAVGKQLLIGGQGKPLVSNAASKILSQTVTGMTDDNTWEMERENVPYTTGRQFGQMAYNPAWKMNTNFVWGYDSGVIENALSFAHVVGTTEASRRHYDDIVWRGEIDSNGTYGSEFTYGFGANGDVSYDMMPNDWQQMWQAKERFGLIYPDAPLGAGLIVASSAVDSPTSNLFGGGGMGGNFNADREMHRIAALFERLHDSGLSIPFSSNIATLSRWKGRAPLILTDLSTISDEEAADLKDLAAGGDRIAAFGGARQLSPAVAALFGLTTEAKADKATVAGTVDRTSLLVNGNFLYIPFPGDSMTLPQAQRLAAFLQPWLQLPITFPEGTMGYGFVSGGQKFVVLEDWMEKGRMVALRIHADGATAHAVGLNDHNSLKVTRDGSDWLVQVPLRPGDGEVVVLEEKK